MLRYFLIIILFFDLIFEIVFKDSSKYSGVIHILVEIIFISSLFFSVMHFKSQTHRTIKIFSIADLVACTVYGYFIYYVNHECSNDAPNCLLYGVPFNIGAFSLMLFLRSIIKQTSIKHINLFSNITGFVVFSLYCHIFVFPQLLNQDFPLIVKIVGSIYSLLVSFNIGYSIVLLFLYFSIPIQLILYSIILNFTAEIALRSKNINPTFLGIQVFENIFVLSIFFMFYGFDSIRKQSIKKDVSMNDIWNIEIKKYVPIRSIRSITVVCLFLGFLTQWLIDKFDMIKMQNSVAIASSLLNIMFIFGITIMAVNFFTRQLSQVSHIIGTYDGVILRDLQKLYTFHELSIILSKFNILYESIKENRDYHANANAFFAHHVPQCFNTIKRVIQNLNESPYRQALSNEIEDLSIIEDHLKETTTNIMFSCQTDLDAKKLIDTVKDTIAHIQRFHPDRKIILSLTGSPLDCSTRVVGFGPHLKNIIQNSIYASTSKSEINLILENNEYFTSVKVKDYGVGMSNELISRLLKKNEISLKEYGNGIGLSSAFKWAESISAELLIKSKIEQGTEIEFIFKKLRK